MSAKQVFKVERKNPHWAIVAERVVGAVKDAARSGQDFSVTIGEIARSLDQNSKQWPMLADIAGQVPLTINGASSLPAGNAAAIKVRAKDWKNVLSAVFLRETRIAAYDGAVVSLGASTSQFGRRQFSEYIEFLYSVGAEHGVTWSEKAQEAYALYRTKQTNIPTRKAA